jgi:hypothetical protein
MAISRDRLRDRVFVVGVSVLVALAVSACVSVQKSGNQESPSPPRVTTGVMFQSIPGNAEVYVDGDFRGTTPLNLGLSAGTHTIELRLNGYTTWERELVVIAGEDTRVAATLELE